MNRDRYTCCDPRRRAELLDPGAPANLSGIDYVEVRAGASVADPTFIDIVLVKPLPLPLAQIDAANIHLTGGVRYPAPIVANAVTHTPGGATVSSWTVEIPGNQPTDFSTYQLAIVAGSGSEAPPAFLDPRLSSVEISFKLDCPSPGDCAVDCEQDEPPSPSTARFDYRTRDYEGFRRQMLDRLAELVPGFDGDDPVDMTTTLVEALAYRADQQSYRLDWVGTEAFLMTARSRASVARHARLMDYAIGEGCSARSLACFDYRPAGVFSDGLLVREATALLPRQPGLDPVQPASALPDLLKGDPVVFETRSDCRLWAWRNAIGFHTWSDDECSLGKGATAATLVDTGGGNGSLAAGDLLVLVETRSPETGEIADANPARRHAVRLTAVSPITDPLAPAGTALVTVEWGPEDALPFDLVLQARRQTGISASVDRTCAVALGNVVCCDHGVSLPHPSMAGVPSAFEALRPSLDPPHPSEGQTWSPRLGSSAITRLADPAAATTSASAWFEGGQETVPVFALQDNFSEWTARGDLLRSDRFDRHFVIETGIDGAQLLRFGDGINGLEPSAGQDYSPSGRFGSGRRGNIGRDALYHLVLPDAQAAAPITVTNPLAASGGSDPEPIGQVRINAPQAFRTQERAVVEADYAAAAMQHPAVANARAVARWTGAWQTIVVYLDLVGGEPFEGPIRREIAAHMERYRLIGYDIIYRAARMIPLALALHVCAAPGQVRGNVERRVRAALRPAGAGGNRGFFHPDNFSFGQPLYVSQLVAFVAGIEGVASVEVTRLHKADRPPLGELAAGLVAPDDLEILQMRDSPDFPEQGILEINVGGGDG